MKNGELVLLDACVLIPMPLVDTLLRFAEEPALYRPCWSQEIMDEVSRNLATRWRLPAEKVQRRQGHLRTAFPEAWVTGHEGLISLMGNDLRDRHVLAAAVHSRAQRIVTFNLRDFPREHLWQFGIECVGPATFLRSLYDLDPEMAVSKIKQQANDIGLTLEELMKRMRVNVPEFVAHFCEAQSIQPG